MGEPIYINGVLKNDVNSYSVEARAFNPRRRQRHLAEAEEYRNKGYIVEDGGHPNGAYFAHTLVKVNNKPSERPAHELSAGRICAKKGFSFTLDPEGKLKITMPNGSRRPAAGNDGLMEGYAHEIMAMKGNITPDKVSRAIQHSLKQTKGTNHAEQATIALSITPKGNHCTRATIYEGVKEYRRRLKENETHAKPRIYIHIDEESRKIWYWEL